MNLSIKFEVQQGVAVGQNARNARDFLLIRGVRKSRVQKPIVVS
jgi:hypothetical protein